MFRESLVVREGVSREVRFRQKRKMKKENLKIVKVVVGGL